MLSLYISDTSWKVLDDFYYDIGNKDLKLFLTIPKGFVTDLGSVPSLARIIFNPADPLYAQAYVVHDFLCSNNISRIIANSVFYVILLDQNIPKWKAKILFYGVSLYGVMLGK